jgi:fermentation-respiration switch protein FrsA (DUF1100 family)
MIENDPISRENVSFDADGDTIRGWLFRPRAARAAVPLIVAAAGYSCVKEMHMSLYAQAFAARGLAVLTFDFRNLGESGGAIRQELDPWRQIEDYRHAITYARTLEGIDPERIGIWGTSYAGGHVLVVAATDRRVKCVVSQTPTISGHAAGLRRVPMDQLPALIAAFDEDRRRRMRGEPPTMRAVVGPPEHKPVYPSQEVREWFMRSSRSAPNWRNEVTLRSMELARAYEPGAYVSFISPTPLLMILGRTDAITFIDLQLDAFNRALEPKQLVLLQGGHFSCYEEELAPASEAAAAWCSRHLLGTR